jgi:hypothetical protein
MHLMNAIRAGLACSLVSLLAACGGGGGEGGRDGTTTPVATQNAYPATVASTGDWYAYASTEQRTSPSGYSFESSSTSYVKSVTADGKLQRVYLGDLGSQSTLHYDATGQLSSEDGDHLSCEYAAGYRRRPLPGAAAGSTFATSTVRTCKFQGSVPDTTVSSITVTGKAEGLESRTTTLGTFQTFKSSYTSTTTHANGDTNTSIATCWDDVETGAVVECQSTVSSTAKGAAVPRSSSTLVSRLVAYGRSGQAPVGPAVRRFAGTWRVQFSGDDSGSCSSVRVALDGAISGSCAFGGSVSYGVTGQIADNGDVTVNVDNGAQLTGTAGTPLAASGTWTLGSLRGSWTASHQ